MAELIYSIANIFNDKTSDGCLYQYEAKKFHIPAYQRGYKWGSENDNEPVLTLLNDLNNSFKNNPDKKYYLQYITVSKKEKEKWLEVIDGQQRLTTLSILLSVVKLLLKSGYINPSEGKLHYAVRPSIFEDYIYPADRKFIIEASWSLNGIEIEGKTINSQDVYYLQRACFNTFVFLADLEEKAEAFINYVLNNVIIIVNSVEAHIPGEKVFRNLNSNKVPLTEVDLIKGLLLTRVARHTDEENQKKRYREVLEVRTSLGKQWDEIAIGVNEPDFKDFFFKTDDGLQGLIELVALMNGYELKTEEAHYPVFNFYNRNIKRIHNYFEDLKVAYGVLRNWYNDPKIYNLLGFLFYSRGKKDYDNSLIFLRDNIKSQKKELVELLIEKRKNILPENVSDASYDENPAMVHNILLALNAFPNDIKEYRFDFYQYKKQDWTLEHVFPQSPEGKGRVLNKEQKAVIKEMLGGDTIDKRLKALLIKSERSKEEKEEIQEALKSIGELNSIGNMALLSHSMNSSIGCGLFNEKRSEVLNFIEKGYFVPIHTFGVFSKSIFNDPGNFLAWDKTNITAHQQFIENKITKLREEAVAV